jgi:pilus assembly protein Flp/PilA
MRILKGHIRGRRGLFARDDRGATAVEYGLMVGFIAVVIIVGVSAFGASVRGLFEFITASLPFG